MIDFADAIGQGDDSKDLDRYYLAAVASARRRFDEIRELEAVHKLAVSYLSSNAHRQANIAAEHVIKLAGLRGETRFKGEATRIAGICTWKLGNSESTAGLFCQALDIAETIGDERMKARVLADKGDWMATKSPDLAEVRWREARKIFCRLGENDDVLRLDRNLVRHNYKHARPPARFSQAV